jgi:hypothetical protein
MEQIKNERVKAERLTAGSGHFFYGYYDNPAFSQSDRYHLGHRVQFWDRLPESDDIAELGMIDLETREFLPLAETAAWNFQQGTMLQWNPQSPEEEIIFNVREHETYRGVIMNIRTKERRYLEQPVVNVDPTGRYALSVNFNRMFDFRPGYGYAGIEDAYKDVNHPAEDGIYLTDLTTGQSRLILSLQQIWEFRSGAFDEDQKLLINHITFNTDGTRFLFLARNFPKPGGRWSTAIITANTDGSELFLLSDYSMASHYHWKDPEHVVFWSRGLEGGQAGDQLYVLKDRTHQVELLDPAFFLRDGHCSYSPDRNWLLYDSYPDADHYRHLYLYDLNRKQGVTLASYYSDPLITGDIRCDLHPRWNRAGTAISFDSIHEGQRHVYYMDLQEVMKSL